MTPTSDGSSAAVLFSSVSRRFGDQEALRQVSVGFLPGTLNAIVGPSGCGKTTLLRMVNRLEEPTEGVVWVRGRNVLEHDPIALRRSIGYVIQEIGLFPHYTVFENIAAVPRLLSHSEAAIGNRVRELLEMMALGPGLAARYPSSLSGGERQRVGLARALAADPDILVFDEPFAALDPINRRKLQDSLREIQACLKKTILFVTHDMEEALRLGDTITVMSAGRVAVHGTPEEVFARSDDEAVSGLLLGGDLPLRLLARRALSALTLDGPPVLLREGDVLPDPQTVAGTVAARIDASGRASAVFVVVQGGWSGVLQGLIVSQETAQSTALSAMLRSRRGFLVVTDSSGRPVGVARPEHFFPD